MKLRRKRVHMFLGLCAAVIPLLAGLCGCIQMAGPVRELYRPGRRMLMVVKAEIHEYGLSVTESTVGGEMPKRVETRGQGYQKTELELPMETTPASWPACVAVRLTIRRFREESSHSNEDGAKGGKSFDSAKPPSGDDKSLAEYKRGLAMVKSLWFSARVDAGGRVLDLDAGGAYVEEAIREGLVAGPTVWKVLRAGKRVGELAPLGSGMFDIGGLGAALEDAAAYLPPADTKVGQKWSVRRDKVMPYQTYPFYMITNGCGFSTERSVCRLESVIPTLEGRVATVKITGRRVPKFPEPSMPKRVSDMALSGRLRYNPDTGEVVGLRIELAPRFLSAEDKRMISLRFVNSVTLRRLGR